MKKTMGILATVALALPAFCTTYYVDSEKGNDTADGQSAATAWQSLEKVNDAEIKPGDTVRFKRGGLWRGTLRPRSGEEGRPVTYTWYGKGRKPILQQSVDRSRPEDWVEVRKGLWTTLPTAPEVKEQIWAPGDGDSWEPSFQEGYKGSMKKVSENGETFHRVALDRLGPKIAPNFLQIWGPRMDFSGDALFVRMKIRSTKPFMLQTVRLMQGTRPYNVAYSGHFSKEGQIGAEWSEVSAVLTGGKRDFRPRFHFNLGDILPEGGVCDFKLLGVWRPVIDLSRMIPADVGIFICNHGEKWGVKKWSNPEWTATNAPVWQRSVQMAKDLDYTYNEDQKRVYVVSDRNPGERFDSIELAMTRHIVSQGGCHDVVYDGLWVRYGAAHGFGGGSTRNLVIRNCDVSWIGGGLQFWRRSEKTGKIAYPVRFGNGIEFWGTCHNNLVERNRLWECYDAATTNQGRYDDEVDITWRDNVIWNSEYSFEYWNAQLTRNIAFVHNTCVDAGYGWAHAQRPDINGAHLMYYSNRAATTNFVVRDNIFCRATEWTARSALDWRSGLVHDHNLIWNEGSVPYFRWLEGKNLKLCTWEDYLGLGFDPHGQRAEPQFVDPAKRDYRLKAGTPGTKLASDGGPVGARNMPGLDGDQSVGGYETLWNDEVNAAIDARIEKYRKADARVAVAAPDGTEVEVEQISHAFQFGSHIFNFDQLGRDDWNALYRSTFTNLWNAATIAFYWQQMEPVEGQIRYEAGEHDTAEFWKSVAGLSAQQKWERYLEYRRPAPEPCIQFCEANHVAMHGHVMIYPPWHPAWVTNGVDKAGLADRFERRIRQFGKKYGERLGQWDVVNESVDRSCTMAGPVHDKVCWGRPNMLVPDDYTFRCFQWAAEAFPRNVGLVVNDSWRDIYVPFVRSLIDRGAKIDVVGIQMHIFLGKHALKIANGEPCISNGTSWAPADQIEMFRKLDTLGRPIHLSEITIPGTDDSPAGQEMQAKMMRDNYRLWFSWPSIYRITYWNLVDYTFHAESLSSGIYTKDMKKKKSWYALDQLINHDWKTRTRVKVANGTLAFRGFKGNYRLRWQDGSGQTQEKTIVVK